jgi:hypothetical protein
MDSSPHRDDNFVWSSLSKNQGKLFFNKNITGFFRMQAYVLVGHLYIMKLLLSGEEEIVA